MSIVYRVISFQGFNRIEVKKEDTFKDLKEHVISFFYL